MVKFLKIIFFLILLNFNLVNSLNCSAGVLPYSIKNGKVFLLVGQSQHRMNGPKVFGDFGGGSKGKEAPIETAAREGSEELLKIFGVSARLKRELKDIKDDYVFVLKNSGKSHQNYYCYFLKVPYTSPDIFLNVQESIEFKDKKYQEISAFSWIDAEELIEAIKSIGQTTKDDWRSVYSVSIAGSYGKYEATGEKKDRQKKTRESISGDKIKLFHWFVKTLKDGFVKSDETINPINVIEEIVKENKLTNWFWGG